MARFRQSRCLLTAKLAHGAHAACVLFIVGACLTPWVPTADAQGSSTGGSIALVGQLDLSLGSQPNSDIWGWVDPNTQKEYAIVGEWNGNRVWIVDVSDPTNPTVTSTIPTPTGFDVKTWDHYLYLVDGDGSNNDGRIYDIANPASPVFVGSFLSAHNIFFDANGYMYNSVDGLSVLDVAANPTSPSVVWSDGITGGHDATTIGNMLYDFHGSTGTFIYDVTTPSSPTLLGSLPINSGIVYSHSGWPSADGNYLYVNDELGQPQTPDITVWNISDPAAPFKVDEYIDFDATIHNGFRVGNFYYTSYYVAGFRVFDISDPLNIVLADEFDTAPGFTGNGVFAGCWGVYPFAPSGNIYVSDMQNGLFIFSFTPTPTGIDSETPAASVLGQNYPNPFNPTTTIAYDLTSDGPVSLDIFNATGQRVRTLVSGQQNAGPRSATWNGRDDASRPVASGVYFYRLQAGGRTETKRMVLLK